jgi:MFS family permease
MTCEAYYDEHEPPPSGTEDRCSVHEIEASTATAVAILGFSTTFFGIFNLFVTGWGIKRFGVKATLVSQIFCPAIRLAVQNLGVMTGGASGILIIQCSQIITIIGGPAGYLLALNNFVAEVIEPSERTGALGQLQGCAMFGTSVGFLAGGLISDIFNIEVPFRVSWILFLTACAYAFICLPKIPTPEAVIAKTSIGLKKFFGPLKTFAPQKWTLEDGRTSTQYGAMFLGIGVFLGILATGIIPILLQLYSTDVLGFGTTENGALISMNSMVRGLFLTLAFPKIISSGRKWMNGRKETNRVASKDSGIPEIPTQPNQLVGTVEATEDDQPIEPTASPDDKQEIFDLQFTKYSLLADGLITGAAMFVREGWQMYLVAMLLPFASGTGSSAKGTILQMCPASERSDALSAITLIESIARLSTSKSYILYLDDQSANDLLLSEPFWYHICPFCGYWPDTPRFYLQCRKSQFHLCGLTMLTFS